MFLFRSSRKATVAKTVLVIGPGGRSPWHTYAESCRWPLLVHELIELAMSGFSLESEPCSFDKAIREAPPLPLPPGNFGDLHCFCMRPFWSLSNTSWQPENRHPHFPSYLIALVSTFQLFPWRIKDGAHQMMEEALFIPFTALKFQMSHVSYK